jgi:hypothetical protein
MPSSDPARPGLVSNGDSDDMTVIDPRPAGCRDDCPGPDPFLAADGKGTVWTNLFDKGAFVTVDVKSLKVTKTTPDRGCKGASSMAPIRRTGACS